MVRNFWITSDKKTDAANFSPSHFFSKKMRAIAWVNIFIQLLLPLSSSFSTTTYAASAATVSTANVETERHVIGVDESVESIAKKYGMTIDELKRINIYRTFSKPFYALTAGDEIDVPRKTSPFAIDNKKKNEVDTTRQNKLISHAQTGAAALASGNVAKSGERMARSLANSEINNSVQQWLGQFGTARVQMNVNDDFKLDGSAADVLVPVYDNHNAMLFTQLGVRNKDSRNTLNIGAGVRTFHNDWMYGANTFFDNDITGKNRRVGIGAEAWTDYLKLAANSYFGLTDWHQSRDFSDYNERPADGYDIRAEAYLPSHPQLGGKLMYEKYRGDEVALFGKDNRQKNPYAVTAGINYTPIPLLTIGAEHRAGKGGSNDSSLNFQLNYRLGESWQSHVNPSAIAASRTLAGSRYDLVERNNNIVLEFQKQDLIQLNLPESINGDAGSVKNIVAQVTSKYGLDRIEWDSASILAAGGTFTPVSANTATIALPPYQAGSHDNTYRLTAFAYDIKGNRSNQAITLINVNEQVISVINSSTTATPAIIVADGVSTSLITVTLVDTNNRPVSGFAGRLVLTPHFVAGNATQRLTVNSAIQLSEVNETSPGVYHATLTAGTQSGIVTVTPSIDAQTLSAVDIRLIVDITSTMVDSLTPDVTTALANDSALITFTAVLNDSAGHVVPDAGITFSATGGTLSATSATTDAQGKATVTLRDGTVESVTVTAKATANSSDTGKSQIVSFVADTATAVVDSLTADVTTALANDSALITFTAVLNDSAGHVVPDAGITFSATGGTLSATSGITNAQGEATVTLRDGTVESVTVTAQATANSSDTGKSQTVSFVADTATAVVDSLTPDVTTALAGGSPVSLVAVVRDTYGHLVPDTLVTFSVTGSAQLNSTTATTGANGEATVTLTNTQAEEVTVSAKSAVNDADPGKSTTVTFTSGVTIELQPLTDKVKVGESIEATLTMLKSNGLPFTDTVTVSFALESSTDRQNVARTSDLRVNGTAINSFNGQTDSNGKLVVTLTEPSGIGVESTFKAVTSKGDSNTIAVIFTVITSPDSPLANMWGHMDESVTAQGQTMRRPRLSAELPQIPTSQTYNNESWALFRYSEITSLCSIPQDSVLVSVYNQQGRIDSSLGWPVNVTYRSSTLSSSGFHTNVNMFDGSITSSGGDEVSLLLASCLL